MEFISYHFRAFEEGGLTITRTSIHLSEPLECFMTSVT